MSAIEIPSALNRGIIKELSKKVYAFPEANRLTSPKNYDQWKQALTILFRVIGFQEFIESPEVTFNLSDADQAVLLMIIRVN